MPDPIQSSSNVCDFTPIDSATAEETNGQVSLAAAHAAQPGAPQATSAPPSAPSSPAVNQLVARFVKPPSIHPPVEPSLTKALGNCKIETALFAVTAVTTIGAAPETFGLAFLAGAAKLVGTGINLDRCLEREEAAQVAAGNRANQTADCQAVGGTAISGADGSVLCQVPR